jgi:iron complex outermembrane recepter protein
VVRLSFAALWVSHAYAKNQNTMEFRWHECAGSCYGPHVSTIQRLRFFALLASAIGVLGDARVARAHELTAPVVVYAPLGEWPGGVADSHDVVVPLKLQVSATGAVVAAELEAKLSPGLDDAALAAARAHVFTPATRDGSAIAATIRILVRFHGREAASAHEDHHHSETHEDHHHADPHDAPGTPHRHDAHGAPQVVAGPASAPADAAAPVEPTAVSVVGTSPPRSASETRLGRDVLAAAPHRTASDMLNVVPGVFVTQHSGEGKAHQIFLRGFDAVHGQDIELSVGGIPVNEVSNIHGQGYADLNFVMPEVVREVVAMPGTYSPRQGDFAVAGSVKFDLGVKDPGFALKTTLGSFGSKRIYLGYHPKGEPEQTFAAFEGYATDGFGPNRAAERASAIGQVTTDLSDKLSLRALASVYAARFDSAGVVRASEVDSGQFSRLGTYDPKQGGHSERAQLLVELHKDSETGSFSIAPFVVLRSMGLRQNFTGYLQDTLRGGAASAQSDNNEQKNRATTFGFNAYYKKPIAWLGESESLEFGLYGRTDATEQSQKRLSEVDDRVTDTQVDATVRSVNAAGYFDIALHPIARLKIRGGIRVDALSFTASDKAARGGDQDRTSFGLHLGKKLTADLAVTSGLRLLASYGDGFRSPQARSLANGERTPFTQVRSFELGARLQEGKRIASTIAVFHSRVSDDLVFDQVTARNEGVPGTARSGASAELLAKASNWLTLHGSITYTRAVFTGSDAQYNAGDLLPYVPQFVARTDVGLNKVITRALGRPLELRLGAGLDWLGRRALPYSQFGRDVFLVDAAVSARLREFEFGVDVMNLLGNSYYDGQFVYPANFAKAAAPERIPSLYATVGTPRAIYASLSLHL